MLRNMALSTTWFASATCTNASDDRYHHSRHFTQPHFPDSNIGIHKLQHQQTGGMSDRGQPSASGRNAPPDILRRKVSFGLELEFLVPWIREGDADPDQDIADDLAPILRIPDCDHVFEGANMVRQAIYQVLKDAGLPVRSDFICMEEDPALDTVPLVHTAMAEKFRTAFEVTADCSLKEVDGLAGYHYTGVEVVSPAFWHDQHGLDMVRLAVSALANAYRLRLNPTCGFHVHVGAGMDNMIDPRTLRRYSAFLWASMPLLNSLHSPERMALHYSGSCRVQPRSLLGDQDGTGAAAALWKDESRTIQARARCVGRDRWLGEPYDLVDDPSVREVMATEIWDEEPWEENIALSNGINGPDLPGRLRSDEVFMAPAPSADRVAPKFSPPRTVYPTRPLIQNDEPITDGQERRPGCPERQKNSPDPPRPRQPAIQRRIPHVPFIMTEPEKEPVVERRMAFYADTSQIATNYDSNWYSLKRHDVMSGVRELLAGCMSSCLPGSLIGNSFSNKFTGTNFYAYTPEKFTYMPFQSRSTVEIRMGSPSLCPDWVPTWASICARILTWCRDVSDVDFMRVIRLLAWAQEEGGQYDVIDLLIDIGAYEETRVAEARLSREVDGRYFDLDNIRGWEECPAPAEFFRPPERTPAYEVPVDDCWGSGSWDAAPDSDFTSHAHHPGDFWGPRPDLIYSPPASDASVDANDEGEQGEDWGEEFPRRPWTADGTEHYPDDLSGDPPEGEKNDGLDEFGLPTNKYWGPGWEPAPATSDEEKEYNTPEYDSPENWPTERVLFPASNRAVETTSRDNGSPPERAVSDPMQAASLGSQPDTSGIVADDGPYEMDASPAVETTMSNHTPHGVSNLHVVNKTPPR